MKSLYWKQYNSVYNRKGDNSTGQSLCCLIELNLGTVRSSRSDDWETRVSPALPLPSLPNHIDGVSRRPVVFGCVCAEVASFPPFLLLLLFSSLARSLDLRCVHRFLSFFRPTLANRSSWVAFVVSKQTLRQDGAVRRCGSFLRPLFRSGPLPAPTHSTGCLSPDCRLCDCRQHGFPALLHLLWFCSSGASSPLRPIWGLGSSGTTLPPWAPWSLTHSLLFLSVLRIEDNFDTLEKSSDFIPIFTFL